MRSAILDYLTRGVLLLIAVALIIGGLALVVLPAHAETRCVPIEQMTEGLARRFEETMRARGVVGSAGEVLLFTDPVGDTWTLIGLGPDGKSCVLLWGTGWETVAPRPAGIEG